MKRFVEVCIGSGLPYSDFIGKRNIKRNFTPIIISLESDREIMYNRINQRVDLMFEAGLVEEVKQLIPHKKEMHYKLLDTENYLIILKGKIHLNLPKNKLNKTHADLQNVK
jgi:tRNA dimethylallyltransferase